MDIRAVFTSAAAQGTAVAVAVTGGVVDIGSSLTADSVAALASRLRSPDLINQSIQFDSINRQKLINKKKYLIN